VNVSAYVTGPADKVAVTEPLHVFLARERPELSPGARLVFMHAATALRDTGWTPATVDLARDLGITPRQTRRYLAELDASGDLKRGIARWLRVVPAEERFAAAMPLAATYFENEAVTA
jgi:hypothetical protein